MKKLALLGTTLGLLIFGSMLYETTTVAAAEQSTQAIKSEVIFPTTKHSLFTKADTESTKTIRTNTGKLLIFATISKPQSNYDLNIAEVNHDGTGTYNVKNVDLEGKDGLFIIRTSKTLNESYLVLFYTEKSKPNVAVDYFFVDESLL